MPWRPRAPVRSFLTPARCRRSYSSTRPAAPPLKILFCGSDDFSIASLRALTQARRDFPSLIDSIHVVHRPGKRTGRGLKTIREVPIKTVATTELSLDTHEIDTFTGWSPPTPIDIVIAVSFGLFVPPRILNLATYGGLNVHPSLLPDLRGPAPIHHALLQRRPTTGVSVQTLHPKHFDHGVILAQTPAPGRRVAEDATPPELIESLGKAGSAMLVHVLKTGAFVPPLDDAGWYSKSEGPIDQAPKLTKANSYIDFAAMTENEVLTLERVLGETWCKLPSAERLIIHGLKATGESDHSDRKPGLFVVEGGRILAAKTVDGAILHVVQCTYPGGKKGMGNVQVMRLLQNLK